MYSSVQPGTQIGVQVSPVYIEGKALMKLKITSTSSALINSNSSEKVLMTSRQDMIIPKASFSGFLASFTASLKTVLAAIGILTAWKACKKQLGLFYDTSTIMSSVFSKPKMFVLRSRLGLIWSKFSTLVVMSDINCTCKYSSYFLMYDSTSFIGQGRTEFTNF